MKIYFVRHGLTKQAYEKNWLVRKGREQVILLVRRFAKEKIKFDEIYSSDLARAKQTANIISKELRTPVIFTADLREFEDKILFQKQRNWKKKDIKQFRRLINFIKSISKNKEENRNILLVAHGVVNRFIISYFMKIPYTTTRFFKQNNTCINVIKWAEKRGIHSWKLMIMNDTSHLPINLRRILK